MRFFPVCAALSLLVGVTPSFAGDQPAKPAMELDVPEYAMYSEVFDFPATGLRIVMQPDTSHDVVTIYTIINHGSADDPPGKEETAHFCEHAWFRSRHSNLPSVMELLNEIGDIGGTVNASTRNDYTDYTTVGAAEYLPLLLKLESLRLTEPHQGILESEIDIEREVIRNEFRWRREELDYFRFDYIFDAVYPEGHPYHGASSHTSIDNIGLSDIAAFMDKYYRPENTTITIVGNFDINEATHLIFSNFAPQLLHPDLKPEDYSYSPRPGIENFDQTNPDHLLMSAIDPEHRDDPRAFNVLVEMRKDARIDLDKPRQAPVNPSGTELLKRKAPIDNKRILFGWSLPAGYREDHWNLLILGGIANSYVANGLRYEIDSNKVGNLQCNMLPEVLSSTMMCEATLFDKSIDPLFVRDRMIDQLSQIWNPDNTQGDTIQAILFNADITRTKMEIMTNVLASLDVFASPYEGRALTIGEAVHLTNNKTPQSSSMASVMNIVPAKVAALGYEYLKRDRVVSVLLEPLEGDEIDVASEESSYSGAKPVEWVVHSASSRDDLSVEGIAKNFMELDLSKAQEFKLANGLRTIVIPHGTAPLAQASIVFPRNTTADIPLTFSFAQDSLVSTAHDPLPIAAVTNWDLRPPGQGSTGLSLPLRSNNITGNSLRLDVRAPSGNLEQALWILRNQLETIKPNLDGKKAYLKDTREGIEGSWSGMGWHISNASSTFLYPNAKWRHNDAWEDVDVLAGWTTDTLATYTRNLFQPSTATLIIVGSIDPAKAKEIAEVQFGSWTPAPGTPPTALAVPAMPTEPSKILIYDDPKKTQTALSRTCRLNVSDPRKQEAAVGVLSSTLGQQTFNTMRVLEGLAYSPSAGALVNSDGSATLSFGADVINSGVGRMLKYSEDAVSRIANGGLPDEELALNKLRYARIAGLNAQSLEQVTDRLTDAIRAGQPLSWLNEEGQKIANVTGDDLKALLTDCNAHSITTLRGPKDVITPELDELGLTYEVVEWKADGEELLWKYNPKAAKKNEKKKQKSNAKAEKEKAKAEKKPAE